MLFQFIFPWDILSVCNKPHFSAPVYKLPSIRCRSICHIKEGERHTFLGRGYFLLVYKELIRKCRMLCSERMLQSISLVSATKAVVAAAAEEDLPITKSWDTQSENKSCSWLRLDHRVISWLKTRVSICTPPSIPLFKARQNQSGDKEMMSNHYGADRKWKIYFTVIAHCYTIVTVLPSPCLESWKRKSLWSLDSSCNFFLLLAVLENLSKSLIFVTLLKSSFFVGKNIWMFVPKGNIRIYSCGHFWRQHSNDSSLFLPWKRMRHFRGIFKHLARSRLTR